MEKSQYIALFCIALFVVFTFVGLFWTIKQAAKVSAKLSDLEQRVMNTNDWKELDVLNNELGEIRKTAFHHQQYAHCDVISAIILTKLQMLKK